MQPDFLAFDMNGVDFSPFFISCKATGIATAFTFLTGVWAAWRMQGASRRLKRTVDSVLTLPLVMPPTVTGMLLLLLFGRKGWIGRILGALGIQVVFSFPATVICAATVAFPLMYRTACGAFAQLDADVLHAARTLGMPEREVFWRVAMPQAWPGIVAGVALTFARALGEFGATLMLAGNIAGRTQTMPVAIYFAVQAGKDELALLWMAVILAFSFAVLGVMNRMDGKRKESGKR